LIRNAVSKIVLHFLVSQKAQAAVSKMPYSGTGGVSPVICQANQAGVRVTLRRGRRRKQSHLQPFSAPILKIVLHFLTIYAIIMKSLVRKTG
jgi:hypothetical protein